MNIRVKNGEGSIEKHCCKLAKLYEIDGYIRADQATSNLDTRVWVICVGPILVGPQFEKMPQNGGQIKVNAGMPLNMNGIGILYCPWCGQGIMPAIIEEPITA